MEKTPLEERLKKIDEALISHNFKSIRSLFYKLGPADISEIFESVDIVQCIVMFRLIPILKRAETFAYLGFEKQLAMLDRLPDSIVIRLLNELDPVDRTKLLEELPSEMSQRFLEMLNPHELEIAQKILSYPEETVGRIMSPEFLAIRSGTTVSAALEQIRWGAGTYPENLLYNIFVIDDQKRYLGQISLAALITADPPRRPVDEIIQRTQPGLSVFAEEGEAVDFFRKYDEPCMPVVDAEGVLVGVVESDDVFDIAEEEATEEIQQFGGQDALEDSYFQTPMMLLVRKRAGWLMFLFIGMLFTANALEFFDESIKRWSYLVFFLPLIISSGGNSGSQAASLMIRGLAVKEMQPVDWFKVFRRELLIGLLLGVILGLLGFIRAIVGGDGIVVGVVLAFSLVGIVLFGALIGSMLPFLMRSIKLDPAVSSSPVIASVVDLVGIVVFFKIAIFFLDTLGWESRFGVGG